MNFEVDKIFDDAFDKIQRYHDEPEDYIFQFVKDKFTRKDSSCIFELKIRPYESPIYIICLKDDDTVHMLAASKKDAEMSGNFVLIDEIDSFIKKNPCCN